jgi:hypothetical protein
MIVLQGLQNDTIPINRLSTSVAVVARDPSFWFVLSNPLLGTHTVSSGVGFEVWRQAGIRADVDSWYSKGGLELNQGENLAGLGDGVESQSPAGWYPQFGTYQYTVCTSDVIGS